MDITKIEYPSKWDNLINDNIDVFVTLKNGKIYCVTIATIAWVDEQVIKMGYLLPSTYIIIAEFSDENIKRALTAYSSDDAYWLRLYSVSSGDEIPV